MGPKRFALLLALLFVAAPAAAEEPAPAPDALGPALAAMGIQVSDLGYRPKGTWARYPHPSTIPHVLPFFNDLLAEPLSTYEFTRTLGNAVEDWLTPAALTTGPDAKNPRETLFQLAVTLGTERRVGGFRRFASGLKADATPQGFPVDAAGLDAAGMPAPLTAATFRWLCDLHDAKRWIDQGLRHVTLAQRLAVFEHLEALADNTSDGTKYFPVYDDVAKVVDEHSLHHGSLRALQATQNARRALAAVAAPKDGWPSFAVTHDALGGVWIGTADQLAQDVEAAATRAIVLVFGARPRALDRIGHTTTHRTLSVALFLQPDDEAAAPEASVPAKRSAPQLASGVLGCGLVYAAGARANLWKTGSWGLGAACFGMGVLVDEGGNDRYEARNMSQGAAYFGAGLCLDAAGDDWYALREGDGQGMGGPGAIGILADRAGDDRYYVESDPEKAGRADYHSKNTVASNNAQGAGFGRRGDISDGHPWAGGLGALLDVDGNDHYEAGNFTQGIGYWYGTGLLWDGGGDDTYRSVYFTQGSGAHFAVGALIDESGNDVHELHKTAGAGLGFGWDVVNAFLIDRGTGNDRYVAKNISIGVAEVRSNAFFLDEGGDDTYVMQGKRLGIGDVDQRKSYRTPNRTAPFHFHMPQVAVFLDLGGNDTYTRKTKDGKDVPERVEADGATWRLRTRDPDAPAGFNVSIGRDQPRGRLRFLDIWPARTPPPNPGDRAASEKAASDKPATDK